MTAALAGCVQRTEPQQATKSSWSRAIASEAHKRNTLRIHWASMNWWGMIIWLRDIIIASRAGWSTQTENVSKDFARIRLNPTQDYYSLFPKVKQSFTHTLSNVDSNSETSEGEENAWVHVFKGMEIPRRQNVVIMWVLRVSELGWDPSKRGVLFSYSSWLSWM